MPVYKTRGSGHKPKKKKFISREKACELLTCDLEVFRKLCILKGVYPHDTKNKANGTKTYYAMRDLRLIRNDPLLMKYFEFETWKRKLRKSVDKGLKKKQENLIKFSKPEFKYDHLIKERYPSFRACLTDLDDCLSLLFMFRQMPSGNGITDKTIELCQKLTDEFMTYVTKARALKKVFVSIRGIYYQVQIEGVDITWVTPFNFPLTIPEDDKSSPYFIFQDYLTFYTQVMRFVNFKLFHSIGVAYPIQNATKSDPRSYLLEFEHSKVDIERFLDDSQKFDQKTTEQKVKSIQERLVALSKVDNYLNKDDSNGAPTREQQEAQQLKETLEEVEKEDLEAKNAKVDVFDDKLNAETVFLQRFRSLFENMVFYFSRECPVNSLEAIVKSFGARVVMDKKADNITHYVVDRPKFKAGSRRYEVVQPQWVFDCVNAQLLLPVHRYRPGETLPPHLSPFMDYKDQDYIPEYAEEILRMRKEEILAIRKLTNPDAEFDEEGEIKKNENELEKLIDAEDNVESAEARYQRELNAERSGVKYEDFVKREESKQSQKDYHAFMHHGKKDKSSKQKREEEKEALREVMLTSKQKRVYKILKEKEDKRAKQNTKLRQRRAELDRAKQLAKENGTESEVQEYSVPADREVEEVVEEEIMVDETVVENDDDFAGLDDMKAASDDEEALNLSDDEEAAPVTKAPKHTESSRRKKSKKSKKRKHSSSRSGEKSKKRRKTE